MEATAEIKKGVIPNKARAEELATLQFNAAKQSGTEAAAGGGGAGGGGGNNKSSSSFFRRRREKSRARSKSLGKVRVNSHFFRHRQFIERPPSALAIRGMVRGCGIW